MDKIITCDFNRDFIGFIRDLLIKEAASYGCPFDLSRFGVVFEGKRPSLFLKKSLSEGLKKEFFPPKIFSIEEFVNYAVFNERPFQKITDMQACYMLYSIAKRLIPKLLKDRQEFHEFLPWAREVLSFIEQLDLEDIDDDNLKSIKSNAMIGYDVPEQVNELLKNLSDLRREFHKELNFRGLLTRGLLYRQALGYAQCPGKDFERIYFCGLFYMHRSELNLVKALYERDKAVLVFQSDDSEWSVFKGLEREFKFIIRASESEKKPYELKVYEGFDSHSQACLAREILKNYKDDDKTVVVLPDADMTVPLLSEIAESSQIFNVSVGYPLKRSSLYSLFQLIFAAQESKKDDKYYTKDYLRLIRHPLVKSMAFDPDLTSATRILVHKIEEALTASIESEYSGSLFIDLEGFMSSRALRESTANTLSQMGLVINKKGFESLISDLHSTFLLLWEDIDNFAKFSSILEMFMNRLLKKSSLESYPLNMLITERILSLVSELKNSSFSSEPFKQQEIFKIFTNILDNQSVSFKGSPLKGLQILGPLETRGLNFENVIVLDVNEQVFPKLSIYEPLIPRDVLIGLGINRLEKQDEIHRYHFMRLIGSAKNVHLIFEGEGDKERSRFIEELIWKEQKRSKKIDVLSIPRASFKISVKPSKSVIEKDKETVDFLRSLRYSPSSINTYIQCPLKFYFRYVLGLKEKEDLLDEPEASDIGNFIHGFLERAFSGFRGRKPILDDAFKKHFMESLSDSFNLEFSKKMRSGSFMLEEIVRMRLKRFLENEEKRQVSKILSLENEGLDTLQLNCGRFSFKYRIDRIDMLSDSSILIIDYKTGSLDLKPVSLDKIAAKGFSRHTLKDTVKSFQLPLYYYFIKKNFPDQLLNACFYNLRTVSLDLLFKQDEIDSAGKSSGVFIEALDSIFKELLDVDVPFSAGEQDRNYCSMCQYFYMCR